MAKANKLPPPLIEVPQISLELTEKEARMLRDLLSFVVCSKSLNSIKMALDEVGFCYDGDSVDKYFPMGFDGGSVEE